MALYQFETREKLRARVQQDRTDFRFSFETSNQALRYRRLGYELNRVFGRILAIVDSPRWESICPSPPEAAGDRLQVTWLLYGRLEPVYVPVVAVYVDPCKSVQGWAGVAQGTWTQWGVGLFPVSEREIDSGFMGSKAWVNKLRRAVFFKR